MEMQCFDLIELPRFKELMIHQCFFLPSREPVCLTCPARAPFRLMEGKGAQEQSWAQQGPAGVSDKSAQEKKETFNFYYLITDGVGGKKKKKKSCTKSKRGVALYIDVQLFPSGVVTQKRRMINFES